MYISLIENREIIESLKDFCKVRNFGTALENSAEPSPRARFIMDLCERIGLTYEIDHFVNGGCHYHNIILRGDSSRMVIAHHDVINIKSENANDNSASVINALLLKILVPEAHVVITDGEEVGFAGSSRLAGQIKNGSFGPIEWVLNLELSGRGGRNFMIGDYPGGLTDKIKEMFSPPVKRTPGSDCLPLYMNGIDTNVINPLPLLLEGESDMLNENGYLDNSSWYLCHSMMDTFDKISIQDMEEFVTEVLVPLVR